jgi:lysine 6-dehydrogenase
MGAQMSEYHYVILGAGRQGTAAAYDLALYGQANTIVICDKDDEQAKQSTNRVNLLVGRKVCTAKQLDVKDYSAVVRVLTGAHAVLSAVPYYLNLQLSKAAIEARTHFCDMGGNTSIVKEQLRLDADAKEAGISIVPDCGMGPGLINTMGAYAIDLLDEAEEIYIFDAGLPQDPTPPWNYELTFHINGLTNEMDGQAVFIRDGKIAYVDTLTEPETIEIPQLGRFEADVTSGGTSTAPWSFLGKVQTYENKVFRYPGHFEWLRAFKALGLFSQDPITVDGQQVIPRHIYHALLAPKIEKNEIRDIGIIRVIGKGKKDGRQTTVTIDLVDRYDPATGFTAMERLTGWHCSVMMFFQASGKVPAGAIPQELAVPAREFMHALAERGIQHQVEIS